MKELVTVIVPTYRQLDNLERALRSIEDQSNIYLKVIVIDDNECEEYSKSIKNIISKMNIHEYLLVTNESNSGSVYSRNIGINLCDTEYITFLDDDDYYLQSKVKKQIDQMISEDSLYSICNIRLISNNGKFTERNRNYLKDNISLFKAHLMHHITGTSTFMFKTDFLQEIGGFYNSDFGDEFFLMEKAILSSDRFSHLDSTEVFADVNPENGLSSWENKIKSEDNLLIHKMSYQDKVSSSELRYVKMRHHAVKAIAYKNGRKFMMMINHLGRSFVQTPKGFVKLLLGFNT